ncbi:hypothetical protein BJY52DRAFT_1228797 [Lactarius psammicola]|nr:hypothetical protein BJY52DRAFT_1228797 [Lactarius psammicola]
MRRMAWVGRIFECGCWEGNVGRLVETEMLCACDPSAESVDGMWEDDEDNESAIVLSNMTRVFRHREEEKRGVERGEVAKANENERDDDVERALTEGILKSGGKGSLARNEPSFLRRSVLRIKVVRLPAPALTVTPSRHQRNPRASRNSRNRSSFRGVVDRGWDAAQEAGWDAAQDAASEAAASEAGWDTAREAGCQTAQKVEGIGWELGET